MLVGLPTNKIVGVDCDGFRKARWDPHQPSCCPAHRRVLPNGPLHTYCSSQKSPLREDTRVVFQGIPQEKHGLIMIRTLWKACSVVLQKRVQLKALQHREDIAVLRKIVGSKQAISMPSARYGSEC